MTMAFPHTLAPTGAEIELRRRIADAGAITFPEFMAVALYWPDGGYYPSRRAFGPEGDFYTAPLTHPVFGALVARQLEEMWSALGRPDPFWVVEQGAGNGRLWADVIDAAAALGHDFARAMRYIAIERAGPPRDQTLPLGNSDVGSLVGWVTASALPVRGLRGVVLANELLDALPVHRVTVEGGVMREVRVGLSKAGAFEERLAQPSEGISERLDALGIRLSEGHRAEVCLALDDWAADTALSLDAGYLLIVDYGHEAQTYYDDSRRRGTLRCYHQHTLNMDPYRNVGRQDISVHVELTSLRRAATAAGLDEAGSATQADFLRALGFDAYRADVAARRDVPTPTRVANLRALDTLVAPEGMGVFKVLAFSKGVPPSPLSAFSPPPG